MQHPYVSSTLGTLGNGGLIGRDTISNKHWPCQLAPYTVSKDPTERLVGLEPEGWGEVVLE